MARWALALLLGATVPAAAAGPSGLAYEPGAQDLAFFIDLSARVLGRAGDASGVYGRFRQRSLWDLDTGEDQDRVDTRFAPEAGGVAGHEVWRALPRWLSVTAAYIHESNGRQGESSRGWNRIAAGVDLGAVDGSLRGSVRLWHAFRVEPTCHDLPDHAGDGEIVLDWRPRRPTGPRDARLQLLARTAFTTALDFPHLEIDLLWRPGGLPAWILGPADGQGLDLLFQYYLGTGEMLDDFTRETDAVRLGVALRNP